MREFNDDAGRSWTATVVDRGGMDFKGRYHFVVHPTDDPDNPLSLEDVRWNSEKTARRTLETMSDVELRRRLRSARGRASTPLTSRE